MNASLHKDMAQAERVKPMNGNGHTVKSNGFTELDTSHDGLALAIGQQWHDVRYVEKWNVWLLWNGSRWEEDHRCLHMTRARTFLRDKARALVEWAQAKAEADPKEYGKLIDACKGEAKAMRSAKTIANVLTLTRSNPEQAATVEQWDSDPWLLGTPGGTVDLRTGELRPASPLDYITQQTKVAPADAGTSHPRWDAFLKRIFRHDPELIPYMKRLAGYALTGLTSEQAFIFAWGQGGNGKGVFWNTIMHVMGDYAITVSDDLLMAKQHETHPADRAVLRGKRLALSPEVAAGKAWDERLIKTLTGGDMITARYMRQNPFEFMPQFLLVVTGNHKPRLKSVDEAMRRRMHLLPFLQNIPKGERNPHLPDELKDEAPAILRWAIDGCLAWRKEGLNPPRSVVEASADYLEAEDVIGQWLAERCRIEGEKVVPQKELWQDYSDWCEANGFMAWSGTAFYTKLDELGFKRGKNNAYRGFRGIVLLRPEGEGDAAYRRTFS